MQAGVKERKASIFVVFRTGLPSSLSFYTVHRKLKLNFIGISVEVTGALLKR
jgi:hypothetical protein